MITVSQLYCQWNETTVSWSHCIDQWLSADFVYIDQWNKAIVSWLHLNGPMKTDQHQLIAFVSANDMRPSSADHIVSTNETRPMSADCVWMDQWKPRSFSDVFNWAPCWGVWYCGIFYRAGPTLSVFLNFFNNKKWYFAFYIKLLWLGVGFLNRIGAEIGY